MPQSGTARYRTEFPIFERCTYLNSCSLGALSRRSRARVNACLDLWDTRGASAWYDTWWAALEELRTRYGRLLGAAPGSVALHPNVSSALGVVASALNYTDRPRVVVTSLDFPTIGYQWMAKARDGVEVVVLESPDGVGVPLEMYERAVDRRTALVATSHVFFTSGADAPCVGNPSVLRMMLSGRGESAPAAASAFSRLVPSCGTVLRNSRSTLFRAAASSAANHLPALSGTSGRACVL